MSPCHQDERERQLWTEARLLAAVVVVMALLLAAFIAGRATGDRLTVGQVEAMPEPRELPRDVRTFHDASNEVTCWVSDRVTTIGLACLPDQWLASARIEDAP